MITLLHLSDLHFATTDAGTQFDRDVEIRAALLRDLQGRTGFDAMLVTGDVAFRGLAKEFERADQWFDDVRKQIGLSAESVFVIPGNHDVNRDHVRERSMLFDAHTKIREFTEVNARDADLEAKLKDASWDFLHSLGEYRNFAANHDCPTSPKELAWTVQLPKPLDDNSPVRLHGLNSAFLSNKADRKANLLVSPFQFYHLAAPQQCMEIVMCHHPSSWLLDGDEVEDRYRTHANLVLTGHEHCSRCFPQGRGLQVCAGAVHPSRGEANWQPTYNIIRLSIESSRQLRDRHTLYVPFQRPAQHYGEDRVFLRTQGHLLLP
jgi:3',5'-cyclic AMP phosphodiesterase CpdA